MLTTRTHRLAEPSATAENDGAVVIEVRDRLLREHTRGRDKGMIEHTKLRLHFDSRDAALAWLAEAFVVVGNAGIGEPLDLTAGAL